MSRVIAIVPAKRRSTGIPGKNWTPIAGGASTAVRAQLCALAAGCDRVIVSTDGDEYASNGAEGEKVEWLVRPPELATDEAPMVDVVRHALDYSLLLFARNPLWTGREAGTDDPADDLILLVQPTQPLRQPKHLTQAIELLRETQADSVVSVVDVPLMYSPDLLCEIHPGLKRLQPWGNWPWNEVTRRQDANPAYRRDGTVYAFWRKTLESGTFYGRDCRPLIIPPEETCPLDTPEDWAEAERRLRARE